MPEMCFSPLKKKERERRKQKNKILLVFGLEGAPLKKKKTNGGTG